MNLNDDLKFMAILTAILVSGTDHGIASGVQKAQQIVAAVSNLPAPNPVLHTKEPVV
jgi:hypothetical protein